MFEMQNLLEYEIGVVTNRIVEQPLIVSGCFIVSG